MSRLASLRQACNTTPKRRDLTPPLSPPRYHAYRLKTHPESTGIKTAKAGGTFPLSCLKNHPESTGIKTQYYQSIRRFWRLKNHPESTGIKTRPEHATPGMSRPEKPPRKHGD